MQDHRLPPLNALLHFEAAAQGVSFSYAAQVLGVSLGAVSRQIKLLEDNLGVLLFERNSRGVSLTDEGRLLYQVISENFDQLRQVSEQIRRRSDDTSITVASTTAFASLWLMPRIADFWKRYPDIVINHSLSNNLGGLYRHNADVYFRYGDGKWPGFKSIRLFSDTVFPICSETYFELNRSHPLASLTLLQMNEDDMQKSAWDVWLQAYQGDSGSLNWRYFNNYLITIQAAAQGHGVAMGWRRLLGGYADQNGLVAFSQQTCETPGAFYLTYPKNRKLSDQALGFCQWLQALVSEDYADI